MPRVNRFRIVNFKYDDEKKYISNELFEFGGKNTLINLENGGGKTVILQLALQVVKPNTPLGSRRFADYFKPDSGTAHIMVEWIQDSISTGAEFLLTGVCFTKGTDGLKYFMYTHEYASPNPYDIKNIPVVNSNKQVTGFSEFYRTLRELSSSSAYRINVYSRDRYKDYRNKLETYNIFEDEFEAIRIINQSEGGIEKFFENAKKSRHVIEKLIIPSMPPIEGDEEGVLAETFKKHMENLKIIPLYQHRIKVYDRFCEKSRKLLSDIGEYTVKAEQSFSCFRNLCVLENLLSIMVKRLDTDIQNIEAEIHKTREQVKEVKYKKDSYKYLIKKERLKSLEERLQKIGEDIKLKKDEKESLGYKIKYQYASNSYIDLLEYRKKLIEKKTMLEKLMKTQAQLEEEYQNYLLYLRILLENEIVKYDKDWEILKIKKEEMEKLNSDTKKNIAITNKERDEIKEEIAVIKADMKKSEKEIKELTQYFVKKDTGILFAPEQSLAEMKKKKDNIEKEMELALNEKNRQLMLLEENRIKEFDIKESLARLDEKRKNIEHDMTTYYERLDNLKRQALVYEMGNDIYSSGLKDSLKNKKDEISGSIVLETNRYYDMNKKKLLLQDLDYYIPDYEIKRVYKFLAENDINCLPGTLWLKYQPADRRKELMELNPLVQYSVVVEESEFEKVKNLSDEIAELVEEYPVALIINSSGGIIMGDSERISKEINGNGNGTGEKLDRVGLLDIYVIRAASTRLALDEKEYTEYVKNIDVGLEKAKSNINSLREDEERINRLISRIDEFTAQYPESYIRELKESFNRIIEDINSLNKMINKIKAENENMASNIKSIDDMISQKQKELEEVKLDIEKIAEYMELATREKELKLRYSELQSREADIENKRDELESCLEKAIIELNRIKEEMKTNGEEKSKIKERINEINAVLTIKEATIRIEGNVDEIEGRIKGLESKIAESQVESVKENIKLIMERIDECKNNIKKNGFDESDMDGVKEKALPEEIQENERELKRLEEDITALEIEERKLAEERNKLAGALENTIEYIESTYGKAPFEFDSLDIFNAEDMFDRQIKDLERKEKKYVDRKALINEQKSKIRENLASLNVIIEGNDIGREVRKKIDFREHDSLDDGTSLWDIMKMTAEEIAVLKNKEYEKYRESIQVLNEARTAVESSYEQLYRDSEWKENESIGKILSNIMKENLFNYEHIKEIFEGIFYTVENMKKATELQLEECVKNKNEMVERCYRRAEAVYDELKHVDSFSKIRIGNTNVKTIEIRIPSLDSETGKSLMAQYLEKCISEIERMKSSGTYEPAKIDEEIEKMMSPVRLFDAVINLNEIVIRVYKPESTLEFSDYIPWETVINWSGGEKLAGFFAMFISIISYLRSKKIKYHGSSKVIWIDNPFGQANAGHLLNYIFELARSTKTQMICFTGLQEVNIYAQFDVVYSLVHRILMSNISVIRSNLIKSSNEIETAFYRVEHDQMSFFKFT